MTAEAKSLGVLLFPEFELLDVCGPLEMFGSLPGKLRIQTIAATIDSVASTQGPALIAETDFARCAKLDWLLVPGGWGTRREAENPPLLEFLERQATACELVMSVCTGSLVLAAAGLLNGRRATTNKRVFRWVAEVQPAVHWIPQARWVEHGKFVTSSGVAAGIDMALAVIARYFGAETAEQIATATEYEWHRDPHWDPFARMHGLV
ncbi:MAG: DJ-1/PfpI family protein [Candidatus Binatia bacterium]|nr:DJ-1/PfpI family protein [Candidatus Binatia bacterium]